MKKGFRKGLLPIGMLLFAFTATAQSEQGAATYSVERDMLIEKAIANNKELRSHQLKAEAAKAQIGTAFEVGKTNFYYQYDQNNIAPNDRALRVFGIEQTIQFPTVYGARRSVYKSEWEQQQLLYQMQSNKLALEVSMLYEQIVYTQHKERLYVQLDTLYASFSKAGARKYELGESTYLEKITAQAKAKHIQTTLMQLYSRKQALYEELNTLVQGEGENPIACNRLELLHIAQPTQGKALQEQYLQAVSKTYHSEYRLQGHHWLPDLSVELFSGTNPSLGFRQHGFQVGVAIPLFFGENVYKRKVARLERESWEEMRRNRQMEMESYYRQKTKELAQHQAMINYYSENGQMLSAEILKTAHLSYQNGEIDFFQYIQSIENAIHIEIDYLDNLLAYNHSYLELHYFETTK